MKYYGPRERLLGKGAKALTDAELIAVLLGSTRVRGSTDDNPGAMVAARTLLEHFGTLHRLLAAPRQEIQRFAGVGPQKSAMLLAVPEIAERLWNYPTEERRKILSSEDAFYLFSDLQLENQEVVAAAFLASNHQLIGRRVVFRGTGDSSLASPREIFSAALQLQSHKVVVAHNHPSGETEPSAEDIQFTKQLQAAGDCLGIPLLDHLIIGKGGEFFSFTQSSPKSRKSSKAPDLLKLVDPIPC